jgi:23S rRNA pseudouridine1911/1915/1917 synthase
MIPQVLFEDSDVVVIDKPAGLIVHSDGRTEEASVAEWVLRAYPEMRDVGEPWQSPQGEIIPRPGIVHRLDRDTSGVLILAKHTHAHEFLKAQFQDRTTEKEYATFVYGFPKNDAGTIEVEIVRIRSTPPRWGTARRGESKKHREAVTAWRIVSRGVDAHANKVAYLAVFPKTGRTHQIRVHLKHHSHPIVCDPLYAQGKECLLGFQRTALHAHRLSITLPSGERKTFEAPLPEDFKNALATIAENGELW